MLEADPQIISSRDYFQPGAQPRIGVANRFERLAVQQSAHFGRVKLGRRELALLKHVLPGALRDEGAPVQQARQHRVLVLIPEQVELLFRAVVLTGEAQQLEQECPLRRVRRIVAQVLI